MEKKFNTNCVMRENCKWSEDCSRFDDDEDGNRFLVIRCLLEDLVDCEFGEYHAHFDVGNIIRYFRENKVDIFTMVDADAFQKAVNEYSKFDLTGYGCENK